MTKSSFKIDGMDCAEEVSTLRSQLARLPGVQDLALDVLNGKMTVEFDESVLDQAALINAVSQTGMRAAEWREGPSAAGGSDGAKWVRSLLTVTSGLLIVVAFIIDAAARGIRPALADDSRPSLVAAALYLAAAITGGLFVLPKAWYSLRRFRPDMNLLMTFAVGGAIAIGQYLEAASVAFLFAVSIALESWSVGRARRALASLLTLTPPTARVIDADGKEIDRDASDVGIGSRVMVWPGERFPLDGQVVTGETTVDQAPITGESVPVSKAPGDQVFAGTINQDGAVEMLTTKRAEDTTLAKIIRMVGEAQSKRSASEKWVDSFARYYTPAVLLLAVLVMLVPPLFVGHWTNWFYQGLVLLVIACPCALVISTPVSVVAGMTAAANNGVLIKAGEYLEIPAELHAIAFDKTGTLTRGEPEVRQVIPLSGHSADDILRIAASMESRSDHPLGRAIIHEVTERRLSSLPAENVQAIRGKGMAAQISNRPVWLGSHRLLEERGQETPAMHERLVQLASDGVSVIVVGEDDHVCGFIALADAVRPEARMTVSALHDLGVRPIVMLTGDNEATAQAVARAIGMDQVLAELLPEDKVKAVEKLVSEHGHVAMVGDGVNDAPAMARASLGIAMGAAGTDTALETADIALMEDNLAKLPWLIGHSRQTLLVIRQNIAASLCVKLIFVVLTLLGHSSLWMAIAADMGTSLVVIANGLRLMGRKSARNES